MRKRACVLAAGLSALAGCGDTTTEGSTGEGAVVTEQAVGMNDLKTALDARKAAFGAQASDEIKAVYADGVEAVRTSGVVAAAKGVGDEAPGFELPDATGAAVALSDLLAEGPVVLVWYRGGWCPYCNITLRAYQARRAEIEALGARLVAISPELPDNALSTKEKNELEFVVLTDENNTVARLYGVVFDLTGPVHEVYNERFGFDAWNGQSSGELPLAATYVIGEDGRIAYAFLDEDYTARAEPGEVIAALRDLVGGSN